MDVSSDSRLAAARKRECAKCAKYDRINPRDELDGRTACCGCMRTHRDLSVCFTASLHLDDSRFHYGMCNDCVHTLTVEGGSTPLLRTFKTFSVPGAAMGRSDAGGSIPDPTTPEGIPVDLGNGVMVTATTTRLMDAEEEKEDGGAGGGGEGVQRALSPPVMDLWSVRRVAAKAKAAYAALPSASAGVAVTATAAAAAAVAVAAAARSASSASASYALTPANVAEVGGGSATAGEGEGARGGGGAERSPRPRRPKKLDDVNSSSSSSSSDGDGCGDDKSCKRRRNGSRCSDGSGSTAPNSLEESVKFFSDGGSSGSSGRDGGGSLASASRTSSSVDMGEDMAAAAAAAAVTASLQEHRPQQQQQQQQQQMRPLAGVRARAQALERKLAGLEDVSTPSMKGGSETLVGVGGRSVSGSSSSGFVGNLSGRAVVVARGGNEGGKGRACGSGGGGGGDGGGEVEMEKEREQVEMGGGRRSRLFYCGVAAVGVGLVGAAVWAFGGRPSRR